MYEMYELFDIKMNGKFCLNIFFVKFFMIFIFDLEREINDVIKIVCNSKK